MIHILLDISIDRQIVLDDLKKNGVGALFHYIPLHSSPGGRHFGRTHGDLPMTDQVANQVIRLPLWVGMTEQMQDTVIRTLKTAIIT